MAHVKQAGDDHNHKYRPGAGNNLSSGIPEKLDDISIADLLLKAKTTKHRCRMHMEDKRSTILHRTSWQKGRWAFQECLLE